MNSLNSDQEVLLKKLFWHFFALCYA